MQSSSGGSSIGPGRKESGVQGSVRDVVQGQRGVVESGGRNDVDWLAREEGGVVSGNERVPKGVAQRVAER